MMDTSNIKLVLKDGNFLEISKKAASLSEKLKNDFSNESEIPINEIDKKTLEDIIEYLNHYQGVEPPEIEKPLNKGDLKDILTKSNENDTFAYDYIEKFSPEALSNLCVAANYLGIDKLLDLCCAKIAYICKDKDEDAILKTFGITQTFTEEEKQKIKDENSWIEDNI